MSGRTVTQVDEDELLRMVEDGQSILHLKQFLSRQIGHTRFQQRLFNDAIGELYDDMPLESISSAQLVILDIRPADEAVANELLLQCRENNAGKVERLLQKPCDPNCRGGIDYHAPIHAAAAEGHLLIVRLLLEAGADKDSATTNGATALYGAAHNGHSEVVQCLLEADAEKDAATINGTTALNVAAQNGHIEVVRLFLGAGTDKDAATTRGRTSLHDAAYQGHLEVVRLLLQAGADKDATTTRGRTPLHDATYQGHLEVVRLLLEAEADACAETADGETALDFAKETFNNEIVELLSCDRLNFRAHFAPSHWEARQGCEPQ